MDGFSILDCLGLPPRPEKVVILSADRSGASGNRALEFGPVGYLSKDADGPGICEAVVAASRGETVVPPDLQTAMAEVIRSKAKEQVTALTPRELSVLRLVATGRKTADVARELHLGQTTVKSHLS